MLQYETQDKEKQNLSKLFKLQTFLAFGNGILFF